MSFEPTARALLHHAGVRPLAIALDDGHGNTTTYGELAVEVASVARRISGSGARCVALLADNSPAWAIVDLAALTACVPLVPLPGFFTEEQIAHALEIAGVDLVITDAPARIEGVLDSEEPLLGLSVLRLASGPAPSRDVAKVTFTSGTTGTPKGSA